MTVTDKSADGAQLEKREDLITLTIDDVEVSVPKGTLVIRAAELIGVAIPRFCDHPLLEPVGACRQCMVEVPDAGNGRAMPKPQTSCTLQVAPGMVVNTQVTSPVAEKAQHGMMEFLLINHPLDCPICDKGGECPLQNQAMSNGAGESRYEGVKRTFPKPISISAEVLLDRDRCILCARCTRFSEQIAGDPFIELVERGALQQVGIYEKEPFESYWSGNTIQICPVGALTSSAYRFRSRPFDLVSTPSVAEHDACGAAVRVDHRRGTVMRRMAGDAPEVNEEWISDKDRFAFRSGRGDDRLTMPLVRRDGELHPASWPEALDVAVRGLQAAGNRVGVLTGGRLTVEDAYGYSKFARSVLGTNNIDFRSRPHSAEEADFLAHAVAGKGRIAGTGVTHTDIERASAVLLVSLEPEEEAGLVFLRMRKGHRATGLKSWTLAPFLSRGAEKSGTRLVPTIPGAEATVLRDLPPEVRDALDSDAVILVGERAATASGALTAALELSRVTGARLAWIPRRAGDRGAIEAGCLPNLLPGGRPLAEAAARVDTQTTWGIERLPSVEGRDADEILTAAGDGEVGALVVAGVEVADFLDPQLARTGLESADFVISIEQRFSEVSERADVVFPVCLTEEKSGSFLNWEGRDRSFGTVIARNNPMSDLRVLAALADALGSDLGIRTPAQAKAELAELGRWEGPFAPAPQLPASAPGIPGSATLLLASWRMHLDASRSTDGDEDLLRTARKPVARMSPRTAESAMVDGEVTISNDRGSLSLPLEVEPDMIDGVVWVPGRAPGLGLGEHLAASPGDVVRIAGVAPAARTPGAAADGDAGGVA
ncbi:MAG: NADH-quinone oxidoreductase subunit G [Propionibacteriaceae bacterium]